MKQVFRILFLMGLCALTGCRHPEVEYVDFDTFHVLSVQSAPVFMADGSLNPEIRMMEEDEPEILTHYDEWINSKLYTVREINAMIGTHDLKEIMTENGRDKNGPAMSRLYQSLQRNSMLRFTPRAPLYLFHSRQDQMVPFFNALKAQEYFKDNNLVQYDFGDYSLHGISAIRFFLTVFREL